jgi:hypothetical protein
MRNKKLVIGVLLLATFLVGLLIAVAYGIREVLSPYLSPPEIVDLAGTAEITETPGQAGRVDITLIPETSTPTPLPTIERPVATETPSPYSILVEPVVVATYTEWHQDAHGPGRTGYTPEEPHLPWSLLWTWNGPDESGGPGGHFYDAPPEARTVTGGAFIYAPAGEQGLFALDKTTGQPAWNLTETAFNAAPAYDPQTGLLYAGGEDGLLYQIEAGRGEILQTYPSGSALNKAVLLANPFVYVVTEAGDLHKVQTPDMTPAWVYRTGAGGATPPALAARSGAVVFATHDLYVHAVNALDGSPRWSVQPSPLPPQFPFTYEGYWPVVAEQYGFVFVRLNLGMDGVWSGPERNQMYPATNAEIRQFLIDNPHWKNLFALDLLDGSERFIPAVGPGGVETLVDDRPELAAGPVPVIRTLEDGAEVAYSFFRSSQSSPPDGRWDSHIGEMVLGPDLIPGLEAGDLRFIRFPNSYVHITDEQCPLTMAGETIFHAHWGASESVRITDRAPNRGLTYDDPIRTEANPVVIRRMQACPDYNPDTHWTTCGLTLYDDGRYWNGPGWWVYWDVLDPPTPSRRAYSEGILPRYT